MNESTSAKKGMHITILGGGPAGVATGYYAKKAGFTSTVYESGETAGGLCATHRLGSFSFDLGAHRFHDKIDPVTEEIKQLLGEDLIRVTLPSRIFHQGTFINFPLTLPDLIRKMGLGFVFSAGLEILENKLFSRPKELRSFEDYALRAYGRRIAEHFLLNYSQKLWGLPAGALSPDVSGKRLRGFKLSTFFLESFLPSSQNRLHLDGSFYYPAGGFGAIVERMIDAYGTENIRLGSRITRIFHESNRIRAVVIDGEEVETDYVVNTMALPDFLAALHPRIPESIQLMANRLRFRNLVLLVILIDRPNITKAGSLYFPDEDVPFNRVSEPKNRSAAMAPEDQTSLLVEIPCDASDGIWACPDEEVVESALPTLLKMGWFEPTDILDRCVFRMENAYPVLEIGIENARKRLMDFSGRFTNLAHNGRNARFEYIHLHDILDSSRTLIRGLTP